jgi:hypothetical protein
MLKGLIIAACASSGLAAPVVAQTCATYPNTLSNGSTADANQVMANFNCAALVGAPSFTGDAVMNGTRTYFRGHDSSNNHWFGTSTAEEPTGLWFGVSSIPSTGAVASVAISPNGVLGLTVLSSGYVGVGTYSAIYTFYVDGSSGGTAAWTVSSDARLKTNVREITGALDLVEQLRGVRFDWRPPEAREVGKDLKLPLGEPQIGFIAQEVEKVAPEAVSAPKAGSGGVYGVKEESLVPILVQAVKEQQAEIRALREEVAALKAGGARPAP